MTLQDKCKQEFEQEYSEYRKKPILIHAKRMGYDFEIPTLEGLMKGNKGDYLVMGIDGETYPVKKSIFDRTYQFKCQCGKWHDVGERGKHH